MSMTPFQKISKKTSTLVIINKYKIRSNYSRIVQGVCISLKYTHCAPSVCGKGDEEEEKRLRLAHYYVGLEATAVASKLVCATKELLYRANHIQLVLYYSQGTNPKAGT